MEWHFLSTIFVNSLYSRENMIVCTNKIYILNSMNLINWFFLSTTVQNELILAVSLFYSLKFSIRQSAYEYKTRIVPCGRFTHALNLNPHNFSVFFVVFFFFLLIKAILCLILEFSDDILQKEDDMK